MKTMRPTLGKRTGVRLIAVVAAALLMAAACTSSKSTSSSSSSGSSSKAPSVRDTSFIIGTPMQSEGPWDPAAALEDIYRMVFKASYDTLITYNGSDVSKFVPDLATSWTTAPDASSYTFKLNPAAKFNSGNPVTSADVLFSFMRLKNLGGAPSGFASNIKSIDTPDTETVTINLIKPDVTFLNNLPVENFAILDSKVAAQHGATDTADAAKTDTAGPYLNTHSLGSGPYQIESYTAGQKLVLDLNPKSWRPAPYFKQIIFQNYNDTDSQIAAVKRGDIDLTRELTPSQLAPLKTDTSLQVAGDPGTTFYLFGMTRKCGVDPAVCKPDVQEAIRLALDYKGLDAVAQGLPVWYGMLPNYLPGGVAPADRPAQDIAKAKALLASAGYPNGFSTTICTSTATTVQPSMLDYSQKIQTDLAKIGITASIDANENSAFLTKFRAGKNGPADGCKLVQTIEGPEPLDGSSLLDYLPDGVYGLRLGWSSTNAGTDGAKYITEQQQALSTVDSAARQTIWQNIATAMNTDGPWIPEASTPYQDAAASSITGFKNGANETFIFDPYTLKRS
jgi:peptide/nickel transport system substrate-binding protein